MRNVIVSGASRGLGLATAAMLASEGYRVIALARRRTDAFDAEQAVARSGPGALEFVACDLTNTARLGEVVRELRKQFGAVYGLVNNAGIGTSGLLATMPDESIEALVRLNTTVPMLLSRHVVRGMLAGNAGGRIINMSSIVAFTGYSGLSVYSATKASLIGFTRSLAREVGKLGITVNAIAPGFISTEMTDSLEDVGRERIARRSALKRMAEPVDVAHAVSYLLSDKARNVTGTVLTVDAGTTA